MKIKNKWKVNWYPGDDYGDILFKRATGVLPEMESSKAVARQLKLVLREGDKVLDVGCGAGHYYVSLKKAINAPFKYTGIDATPSYVELAKKAFAGDNDSDFMTGDIFELPFKDKSFDVIICNNLFLHLPSIKKPLMELIRVANKFIFVRTLIGERSFRIMDVHDRGGNDFEENGEPKAFHFFNIYSEKYIKHIFNEIGIKNFKILKDEDFSPDKIDEGAKEQIEKPDVTKMIGEWQVNGYILQPWAFISVKIL